MDTKEFKALARAADLEKVVITVYQDNLTTVSAFLRCDGENDGLCDYNFLRDRDDQIVQFDSAGQATTAVHMFGYRGKIDFVRADEFAPET